MEKDYLAASSTTPCPDNLFLSLGLDSEELVREKMHNPELFEQISTAAVNKFKMALMQQQQQQQQQQHHQQFRDNHEEKTMDCSPTTTASASSPSSSSSSPSPNHTHLPMQPQQHQGLQQQMHHHHLQQQQLLQQQQHFSNNGSGLLSSSVSARPRTSQRSLSSTSSTSSSTSPTPPLSQGGVPGGGVSSSTGSKLAVLEDIERLRAQMMKSDIMTNCFPAHAGRDIKGGATAGGEGTHGIDGATPVDLSGFRQQQDSGASSSNARSDDDEMVHSQNLEFLGGELGGGGGKLGALGLKDKLCLVCGDKALGYNFNAVSCESCKAFFRRNAFKEIRGRCEGQCDVTVESRSYCKKCRLKKCFTIGMKRDLILNDNQKHVRRQKIHENRLRRQGLPYEPLPPPPPPPPCSSSSQSPTPPPLPPPPIKLEPEKVTHEIAREVDSTDLESVSAVAQQRISEVMKAFKVSFDAPVDHSLPSTPSGVEFLNLADASVRRLVKMAKHLTSFRSLDQEDQISLLKGAVVEVLILRSTKMFDTQNSGWMVPKGGSKLTVQAEGLAKANEESMSFFQQYQRFTMGFLQAIRNDNIILMLIIVLTVLSPDRSNLKAREEIESTQEGYASVLKEYCEKKYPADPLMFAKVLQKLADIRDVNETHTRMLNYMKVDELEPLIVEIFDMNSTNS